MERRGFPSVCTTDVIIGLGTSENADYESRSAGAKHPTLRSKVEYVRECMKSKGYSGAMLTAITTHQQTDACAVFRALGWRSGPWCKSRAHPNTKTRLWFWCTQDGYPDPYEMDAIIVKLEARNNS